MSRAPRQLLCLVALLAIGCSEVPSDETPSGTVALFLDAMDRAERDESALRDAYVLLAAPTRRALAERAHLAGSLGGREFAPWEMIVRGRYRRSFAPREDAAGMREAIDGERATVTVTGEDGQSARVPLVREDGRWRIVIDVPAARE